jgi:hypothetical protein
MTDTFASKSSAPGDLAPDLEQQPGDLTGSLAELERKLRELEREVSSIGRRSAASETRPLSEATPASQATPTSPTTPSSEAIPSSESTPSSPATPAGVIPPRSPRPPAAYPQPSGRLVDEAVESPRPPAPAAATERVSPSEAQLASLAELRRFRDRLERFGRELAAEYDALLGRVMTGLSSAPASSTSATAPPATAPVAPPPAPDPEVTAAEARENALFEGRVEFGVGPFYDIASLGAFERRLAALPGVREASVRRFEASHAVVDVHLSTPVALVRELRRAGESGFSVREVASGRILLTFDDA